MRQAQRRRSFGAALATALACGALAGVAAAQPAQPPADGEKLVNLDFDNQELTLVIKTMADLTGRNFIYDDRVRGRVTIISPTPVPLDQAYAVFESVLQVKGFTTVETPGGAIKVIPVRDAKETSIDTRESSGAPPNRDHFITRLIPMRYIDAESIVATLKGLVSKEAAMAAYPPTNTVILTESASNIRRILAILEAIDVETYRAEIAVIRLEHADATTLADQLSQIYGAQTVGTPTRRPRARRRPRAQQPDPTPGAASGEEMQIITDERTNSLIVLAARGQLDEIREVIQLLDVPIRGGGRIHVYYLKHANAEELAATLNGLVGGTTSAPTPAPGQGGQAQALRAQIAELAGGISITPEPATNSLVIQATQEGYSTLAAVIDQLDIPRPQVLVEGLIMEVSVTDDLSLGFNGALRIINGDTQLAQSIATDSATGFLTGGGSLALDEGASFLTNFLRDTTNDGESSGTTIQAIIRAAASDSGSNILSAPHILTSDNEQAEIRIGNNIPIISSRVESAAGQEAGLATSVNVERQDIGVTLRVTPQITEGDTLRLDIFQEISAINAGLAVVGNAEDVGVPLSTRRVENVVVVNDGETVVIGGLISDDYQDTINKVPFLGDIPVLGWAFKTSQRTLRKNNLLVFLTPHIMRSREDLEKETIRKREEFREESGNQLSLSEQERQELMDERAQAEASGTEWEPGYGRNPVRVAVIEHEARYPLERMREIERRQQEERERAAAAREAVAAGGPRYFVQAGVFDDEEEAATTLTRLLDAGYDGTLVSEDGGEALLHEIRLGPYESLEQAREVGATVGRAHGLSPALVVEPGQP